MAGPVGAATGGTVQEHDTTRGVSETGGQKDVKAEAYDLIPPDALAAVARVFGCGAAKYTARNWERGYPWGWAFAALMRHAWAFWRGEDIDPDSGQPHMAHAAWHCLVLLSFRSRGIGTDDRG